MYYWYWKEVKLPKLLRRLNCVFNGHDWIDFVSIAGGVHKKQKMPLLLETPSYVWMGRQMILRAKKAVSVSKKTSYKTKVTAKSYKQKRQFQKVVKPKKSK